MQDKQPQDKQPGKAGRPEGSKETPQTLLARELKATVKTVGGIREIVETQVDRIGKAIAKNETIPIADQIDMMVKLGELSQTLTKNAEMLAKYLMDKRVRNNTDDVEAAAPSVPSSALRNLLK